MTLRHLLAGSLLPALALLLLAGGATAAGKVGTVPHLDDAGQAGYRAFLAAPRHKAFAIAPGGVWTWVAEKGGRIDAENEALASCQANTRQKCVLFAADDEAVFDAAGWPLLWGPYLSNERAQRATVGRGLGQRFPDLLFTAADGVRSSVAALRGKVVILHFWGSWCGPCRREMPELQKLHAKVRERSDVSLVLLQVREKFDVSQRWARAQGIDLPLFDSGSSGELDDRFRLAGGATLRDRDVASRFPTTYVLDRNGIVVFSSIGPVHRWPEYEGFLRDAAARSGK